mgnify:CR=1 FL=1
MLSKGSYDPFAKLEEIAQGKYSNILAMLHDTVMSAWRNRAYR